MQLAATRGFDECLTLFENKRKLCALVVRISNCKTLLGVRLNGVLFH